MNTFYVYCAQSKNFQQMKWSEELFKGIKIQYYKYQMTCIKLTNTLSWR